MTRAKRVVATLLATLGICVACDSGGGGGDGGETHWLGECASDADCSGGQCLCGVCTRVCTGDTDCAGKSRQAACFETASPGLVERCAAAASKVAPGICLGTCKVDAHCPAGEACLLGACVPAARDASAPVPHDAAPPTPGETATKYVHVDAGSTFGEPVEAPQPRTLMEGADSLVGTWARFNQDGTRCTSDNYDDPRDDTVRGVCPQLELTRDGTLGGITGYMHYLVRSPPFDTYPTGPFAAVTDPSTGYPTGVDPAVYGTLHVNTPGVRYRVFDGVFDGKTLSFWYSPLDLWTDWCALQSPHPFQRDGVRGYRCVPSGATEQDTDVGKLALCTSAFDFGVCSLGSAPGVPYPCICLVDGGRMDLLCRGNQGACSCTAEHCSADLRGDSFTLQLTVSGDKMTTGRSGNLAEFRLVSP